jgi:hypothetical protein
MATPTEDEELGRSIGRQFALDGGRSCRVGTSRFRDFAATAPVSLGALEPQNLIDSTQCVFSLVAERDTLTKHDPTGERCNA